MSWHRPELALSRLLDDGNPQPLVQIAQKRSTPPGRLTNRIAGGHAGLPRLRVGAGPGPQPDQWDTALSVC
jgi:hypothetical protein